LIVGGTMPVRMLMIVAIASIAPAAPRVWPIMLLLAVMLTWPARSPKSVCMAPVRAGRLREWTWRGR